MTDYLYFPSKISFSERKYCFKLSVRVRTLSDLYHTLSKKFRGFPFPSRDVTYQTLSSREDVSLTKPEVFSDIPFPSPEFLQNPFESVSVPIRRQEFSRTFLFQ
jgi:hypothetical protein